jgi:hypothetical protein
MCVSVNIQKKQRILWCHYSLSETANSLLALARIKSSQLHVSVTSIKSDGLPHTGSAGSGSASGAIPQLLLLAISIAPWCGKDNRGGRCQVSPPWRSQGSRPQVFTRLCTSFTMPSRQDTVRQCTYKTYQC